MDIVSFLSTQVPAYYAVIPIVTLIIVLITLIVKPAPSVVPSPQAEAKVPSNPYMAGFQPTATSPKMEAPLQSPPQAVASSPVLETVSKPEGTVPPISAWKPQEVAQAIPQEPVVVTPETPQGTIAVAETPAPAPAQAPASVPVEASTPEAGTTEGQPTA